MKLKEQITKLEEEQRAQLQLAQSGQDDFAWIRYTQLSEHLRTLRSQQRYD